MEGEPAVGHLAVAVAGAGHRHVELVHAGSRLGELGNPEAAIAAFLLRLLSLHIRPLLRLGLNILKLLLLLIGHLLLLLLIAVAGGPAVAAVRGKAVGAAAVAVYSAEAGAAVAVAGQTVGGAAMSVAGKTVGEAVVIPLLLLSLVNLGLLLIDLSLLRNLLLLRLLVRVAGHEAGAVEEAVAQPLVGAEGQGGIAQAVGRHVVAVAAQGEAVGGAHGKGTHATGESVGATKTEGAHAVGGKERVAVGGQEREAVGAEERVAEAAAVDGAAIDEAPPHHAFLVVLLRLASHLHAGLAGLLLLLD